MKFSPKKIGVGIFLLALAAGLIYTTTDNPYKSPGVLGIVVLVLFFITITWYGVKDSEENDKKLRESLRPYHKFYITDEDVILAATPELNGFIKETVVLTGVGSSMPGIRQGAGSPVSGDEAIKGLVSIYGKTEKEARQLMNNATGNHKLF